MTVIAVSFNCLQSAARSTRDSDTDVRRVTPPLDVKHRLDIFSVTVERWCDAAACFGGNKQSRHEKGLCYGGVAQSFGALGSSCGVNQNLLMS